MPTARGFNPPDIQRSHISVAACFGLPHSGGLQPADIQTSYIPVAPGFDLPHSGGIQPDGHSEVLHSSCPGFQPLLLRRVLTRRTLTSYIIFSCPGFQPGGDIGSKETRTLVQCLYSCSESGDGLADKRGFLCWSRQLVMRILD